MNLLHALCDRLTPDPAHDMAQHLLVLYTVARFLPGTRLVEVGVDDGSSAYPLALGAMHSGKHLDSVDVAPCPQAHELIATLGLTPHWTFHQMRSVDYAATLANRSVDVVLIDGDHSPDGVRADWEAYKGKVRMGGLLLFHDKLNPQDFPGIAALIDGTIHRDPSWGVATLRYGWGLTVCERRA